VLGISKYKQTKYSFCSLFFSQNNHKIGLAQQKSKTLDPYFSLGFLKLLFFFLGARSKKIVCAQRNIIKTKISKVFNIR
jgi:hypothetical protein